MLSLMLTALVSAPAVQNGLLKDPMIRDTAQPAQRLECVMPQAQAGGSSTTVAPKLASAEGWHISSNRYVQKLADFEDAKYRYSDAWVVLSKKTGQIQLKSLAAEKTSGTFVANARGTCQVVASR